MNCFGCYRDFDNELEFNFHKNICIYYIYKLTYSTCPLISKNNTKIEYNDISNSLIKNIILMVNILNLCKNQDKINKKNLLNNLYNKVIVNDSLNNKYKISLIKYLYNKINISNNKYYTFDNLINIISDIFNIKIDIILNIISSYKHSKNNLIKNKF